MATTLLSQDASHVPAPLSRRRGFVIACSSFVTVVLVWLVLSCPDSRLVNASAQRTSYGAFRWIEVTSQRDQRGIASLLPIGTVGTHEVDVLRAAASGALALAITVGIVRYLRRELGNLS